MRAPIGFRISSRRRGARRFRRRRWRAASAFPPSYLNLIERNKRDVGGALLHPRGASSSRSTSASSAARPSTGCIAGARRGLCRSGAAVAGIGAPARRASWSRNNPPCGARHRAPASRLSRGAVANADDYADRLRSDPLLSQLLHQILSGITAVRSSAEILEDVADLDEAERRRFLAAIARETRGADAKWRAT